MLVFKEPVIWWMLVEMKCIARTLLAIALLSPIAADAEPVSKLLSTYGAWTVKAVKYDDGTRSCVADIDNSPKSFAIYAFVDAKITLRIQFYDNTWDFGEGTGTNMTVTIDSLGPWNLTNVELYKQSALFYLPDEGSSSSFLSDVKRGNVLYMNSENGKLAAQYSLTGSAASIGALMDCASALKSGTDFFAGN